jgi:hypothetical protein
MESALEDESQCVRKCGLSNAWYILNKQVAPGEESHQRLFDHLALAFDDRLNGFNEETDFFLCLNLWQWDPCGCWRSLPRPSGQAD